MRVLRYAPKRLARRSLRESKRPGEVWLPSRRWAIIHHTKARHQVEDDDEDDYGW